LSTGDRSKPKLTWAQIVGSKKDDAPVVTSGPPPGPPTPSVVPTPTIKPPPVTVSGGVASCPSPSPQDRGYPLGFKDKTEFDQCMSELEAALTDSGINADAVGVRGSSVTFMSNNPNKVGSYFDKKGKGKSDIDVFFVTTDRLKCAPSKKGMFRDSDVAEKYPAIDAWNDKWSKKLNPPRKVAAAGFKPSASMKPTSADSILSSGAL